MYCEISVTTISDENEFKPFFIHYANAFFAGTPTVWAEMCKQRLLTGQNFMDKGGGRYGWKRGQGRQCNYWILDIYRVECTKCIGWCISMFLGKVYPRN